MLILQRYKLKPLNFVIFSLGSNMGNRLAYLNLAIKGLENQLGDLLIKSNVFETEAWGNKAQTSFLNQVVVFQTNKKPEACLNILQSIEKEQQRKRNEHWGPRTLDIDILFFNQEIINTHRLIIPHPFLEKRLFVLLPLSQILADFVHPKLQKNILQLLQECKDNTQVEKHINGI
ncbi:MAG: 2-amino-4-hydroxy-6-hydroxymethyldihydropteridine diphosphokinase [Chitinophagales bacterium]